MFHAVGVLDLVEHKAAETKREALRSAVENLSTMAEDGKVYRGTYETEEKNAGALLKELKDLDSDAQLQVKSAEKARKETADGLSKRLSALREDAEKLATKPDGLDKALLACDADVGTLTDGAAMLGVTDFGAAKEKAEKSIGDTEKTAAGLAGKEAKSSYEKFLPDFKKLTTGFKETLPQLAKKVDTDVKAASKQMNTAPFAGLAEVKRAEGILDHAAKFMSAYESPGDSYKKAQESPTLPEHKKALSTKHGELITDAESQLADGKPANPKLTAELSGLIKAVSNFNETILPARKRLADAAKTYTKDADKGQAAALTKAYNAAQSALASNSLDGDRPLDNFRADRELVGTFDALKNEVAEVIAAFNKKFKTSQSAIEKAGKKLSVRNIDVQIEQRLEEIYRQSATSYAAASESLNKLSEGAKKIESLAEDKKKLLGLCGKASESVRHSMQKVVNEEFESLERSYKGLRFDKDAVDPASLESYIKSYTEFGIQWDGLLGKCKNAPACVATELESETSSRLKSLEKTAFTKVEPDKPPMNLDELDSFIENYRKFGQSLAKALVPAEAAKKAFGSVSSDFASDSALSLLNSIRTDASAAAKKDDCATAEKHVQEIADVAAGADTYAKQCKDTEAALAKAVKIADKRHLRDHFNFDSEALAAENTTDSKKRKTTTLWPPGTTPAQVANHINATLSTMSLAALPANRVPTLVDLSTPNSSFRSCWVPPPKNNALAKIGFENKNGKIVITQYYPKNGDSIEFEDMHAIKKALDL